MWMALRVQWLLAIAAIVMLARSQQLVAAVALILAMLATAAVSAIVADDIGRSFAVLVTACVLGVVLFVQQKPRLAKHLLIALAAANLLLPASHVIYQFSVPIESARREIDRWNHPPDFLDPDYYVKLGGGAMNAHNLADARRSFDIALKLDPRHAGALMNRAWLNIDTEDIAAAVRDADAAVSVNLSSPDALYTSAVAHLRNGDVPLAMERATQALQNAPPGWPRRDECAALIQRVNNPSLRAR
jgi:tetratricopeptide (TPR) repeat protein